MSPIRKIVVVGGGTAGWMSAAALSSVLAPLPIAIELVESEAIGTVGVGEATIPHIRAFNARIGVDEAAFLRATNATIKLGIEFRDWARIGDRYIHPFGAFGHVMEGLPFHQHWLRAHSLAQQGRGEAAPIEDYSLPIVAGWAGKFAPPSSDPSSLGSTYGYAYHFDASLYAKFLRQHAEARGVVRTEGKIAGAEQRPDNGFIDAVVLEDGRRIEGDLFIDCSGFRGLLIEQTLKTGYDDWRRWLPCDSAVAAPCESTGPLLPLTRASADAAGWRWRIPLQHRVGNGYVFCSDYIDQDEAARVLVEKLDGKLLADPRPLSFVAGKRRRQWDKNVVAVGLASGFLEPLESTSIHLIQQAITTLLEIFPDRDCAQEDQDEFNRVMALEYERIRDFLVLHYFANQRDDTPFWRDRRAAGIPDSLAEKMALFRERGTVVDYRDGLFKEPSWLAVYFGQRILPDGFDPVVEAIDPTESAQRLSTLRQAIARAVEAMPTHEAWLRGAMGAGASA